MINIIISIKINQNFTFEQEIIDKLIENSASFSSKTEYSQEKYIKKKKEKYIKYWISKFQKFELIYAYLKIFTSLSNSKTKYTYFM